MRSIYFALFLFFITSALFATEYNYNFSNSYNLSEWFGMDTSFSIRNKQLCLDAPPKNKIAYISTSSQIINEAEWIISAKINFNSSSSNYFRFYICSSEKNLTDSLNGYFVQVGNNKDQILLYKQKGLTTKKIAAGAENRLNFDSCYITLKINRSQLGEWSISSKINNETEYYNEFSANESTFFESFYMGIYCRYSTKNNQNFAFDYIKINGNEYIDNIPPYIEKYEFKDSLINITFSEEIDIQRASLNIFPECRYEITNDNKKNIKVSFQDDLDKQNVYRIEIDNIYDRYNNKAEKYENQFAIAEKCNYNDLIINEIMFDAKSDCEDFVEIYNNSEKIIDLSELKIATYKSDSIIYAAKKLPEIFFEPKTYVVITKNKDVFCECYNCNDDINIIELEKLPTWGATSGSVVLANTENIIIDDFKYNVSMHSEYLDDTKGISLERISPTTKEWASASSTENYSTPGRENSCSNISDNETIDMINDVCKPSLGEEGNIKIYYSLSKTNCIANISIFNLNGVCVRELLKNTLMATSGTINWDGTDKFGELLPISPYIITISFNDEKGYSYSTKKVCTVSR